MMVWHHSQRQRLRYRRTIPVVPQLGHIWGGVTADWWASTGGFDAAVRDGFGKGGASFFAGEGDGGAAWEDAAGPYRPDIHTLNQSNWLQGATSKQGRIANLGHVPFILRETKDHDKTQKLQTMCVLILNLFDLSYRDLENLLL